MFWVCFGGAGTPQGPSKDRFLAEEGPVVVFGPVRVGDPEAKGPIGPKT